MLNCVSGQRAPLLFTLRFDEHQFLLLFPSQFRTARYLWLVASWAAS